MKIRNYLTSASVGAVSLHTAFLYAVSLVCGLGLIEPSAALASTAAMGTGHPLLDGILSTVIYSLIGMAMAFLAFRLVDAVTPGELGHEIAEKHNIALSILAGFTILGICIIIAAALVG